MAYTRSKGFPVSYEEANSSPATSITRSITTGAVGDLVIACVHNGSYTPYTRIAYAASVTDSAGAIGWQGACVRGQDPSNTYAGAQTYESYEIWYGIVIAAATTTAVTASFAAPGVTDLFLYLDEWSSVSGSAARWTCTTAGFLPFTGSSETVDFPSLRSGAHGGLYWGYSYGSIDDNAAMGPGDTPGFTYFDTPTYGNLIVTGDDLAADTSYQPTATQTFNNNNGWYDSIAAIFADLAAGTGMFLVFG